MIIHPSYLLTRLITDRAVYACKMHLSVEMCQVRTHITSWWWLICNGGNVEAARGLTSNMFLRKNDNANLHKCWCNNDVIIICFQQLIIIWIVVLCATSRESYRETFNDRSPYTMSRAIYEIHSGKCSVSMLGRTVMIIGERINTSSPQMILSIITY